MPHAIRIHEHGGPQMLRWESVDAPALARTDVLVRHTAVGLNFIDIYERSGLYASELPITPGHEAAGVVEAIGNAVRSLKVGDRVAYVLDRPGAYCELRALSADAVLKLPEEISDEQAAGALLKGLTAQVLLRQVYRVRKGNVLLIHAAAGGVGSLLVQWAKQLDAIVIALVGDEAKAQQARQLGADHVLLTSTDWVRAVRELSNGAGVDVVYDSVGLATFMRSLDCLRSRGWMISYGNASGAPPAISPLDLARRGSLYLTRPSLFDYIKPRAALVKAASELFEALKQRLIEVHIGQRFKLADAAAAHAALEARATRGATILTV